MNFELSDEQIFLREAARGTLSRFPTVAAAREALEGGALPELWPAAGEAGWPGLLIDEDLGGAGLGALDAMLVLAECGRVLASASLLGHVPATALLNAARASAGIEDRLRALAAGDVRAAYVPACPPDDVQEGWTVSPLVGSTPAAAPAAQVDGDQATLTGTVAWVPDAPGADLLVAVGVTADGTPVAVAIEPGNGVTVEDVTVYDATRPLGHVTFDGATGTVLDADAGAIASAWHLAQCLIAAESLGSVETALEVSVAYAKERFTFGRAIGSYQAVKHALVEVLRRLENTRSLLYYAGWAYTDGPGEFPLAASAARVSGTNALDFAARELISVHGGIGATWEHDAPLYFRRAQISRRLLGGGGGAAHRVAGELFASARAA